MATNWAMVTEFFNETFEGKTSLVVEVYNPVLRETLQVVIPEHHVDNFMKNLPTFEAKILPTDSHPLDY